MIQGSEGWLNARLGKVTASRVADIMPGSKGRYLASRKNYMAELVCERLTGESQPFLTTDAMQWGTDTEPLARSAYEAKTGFLVEEVGLIDHPTIKNLAGSPDGLIGADGGIEIKCPNTATHLDTLLNGTVKSQYVIQMQVNMMCAGRSLWDFCSYDPRLPDKHSMFIKRFESDPVLVASIELEVKKFLAELDEMMERLENLA